jgi:predicted kinase
MTPKIYVLVGMVASGKSTYCSNAAKHGQIILNDDAIVEMLHADDYTLYDKKLKILYKSIENNIISLGLCMGRTVVIDRGLNVSKQARQRWIALARSFDVPCEAVVFPLDAPEVHAKRRFESSNRGHSFDYWLNVARTHRSAYATPTAAEGFDNVHFIACFEDVINGKCIK